jgi:hypothetical protein
MTTIKTQTRDRDFIAEVCALKDIYVKFHPVTDELMFVEIDCDNPSTLWYMGRLVETRSFAQQVKEEIHP